jgi:hypothetical protein
MIEKKFDMSANMEQKYVGQNNLGRRLLKSFTMAETTINVHLLKSKNFIRVSQSA